MPELRPAPAHRLWLAPLRRMLRFGVLQAFRHARLSCTGPTPGDQHALRWGAQEVCRDCAQLLLLRDLLTMLGLLLRVLLTLRGMLLQACPLRVLLVVWLVPGGPRPAIVQQRPHSIRPRCSTAAVLRACSLGDEISCWD